MPSAARQGTFQADAFEGLRCDRCLLALASKLQVASSNRIVPELSRVQASEAAVASASPAVGTPGIPCRSRRNPNLDLA